MNLNFLYRIVWSLLLVFVWGSPIGTNVAYSQGSTNAFGTGPFSLPSNGGTLEIDTVPTATIQVNQFNDMNGDGIHNPAEIGIHPNLEAFLFNETETSVYNRFTDSEGMIKFKDIELLDGDETGFPYMVSLNLFSFPTKSLVTTGTNPLNLILKDQEVQTHFYGIGPDFGSNIPMRLLFIGDSITYGIGDPNADFNCVATPNWGFPRYLGDMLSLDFSGVQVINRGRCGFRTFEILPRALAYIRQERPGYAIIMVGANDLIQGTTVNWIVPTYEQLVHEVQALNIVPIIVPTTPYESSQQIADELWRLSAETDAIIADVHAPLLADLDGLMDDRVHPNLAGHMEIARIIYEAMIHRITGNNPQPSTLPIETEVIVTEEENTEVQTARFE